MADKVRLIDANALEKDFTDWYDRAYPRDKELIEIAILSVEDAPTVEAEPDKGWVIDKLKDKLNQAFSDAVNDAQDYWNPRVAQDALQDAYSNVSCWIDEILNDGEEAQK